jgi:hypothetical protein
MKRKTILILAAALLAALFSFNACTKADTTTYTLTVLVSEGVSGIPAAGAHTLVSGDPLQYGYTLGAGYSKLTVLLDGSAVAASGTLTLAAGDHTLQAYADDHVQRGLTVTLSDGVVGTPAAGTTSYAQGTLVDYSYALADGYYSLVVKVDGTIVDASSGTITMDADHTLDVSATAGMKVPGTWQMTEIYDDDSTFKVTATFSGTYAAGTVTDSDGGSGTYTYTDTTLAFNLLFPHVTYEYTGTFSSSDTMSGTCKRYQSTDKVISGSWMATRQTSTTAAARRDGAAVAAGKKGNVPR